MTPKQFEALIADGTNGKPHYHAVNKDMVNDIMIGEDVAKESDVTYLWSIREEGYKDVVRRGPFVNDDGEPCFKDIKLKAPLYRVLNWFMLNGALYQDQWEATGPLESPATQLGVEAPAQAAGSCVECDHAVETRAEVECVTDYHGGGIEGGAGGIAAAIGNVAVVVDPGELEGVDILRRDLVEGRVAQAALVAAEFGPLGERSAGVDVDVPRFAAGEGAAGQERGGEQVRHEAGGRGSVSR